MIEKIFSKELHRTQNAKRTCLYSNCTSTAINSHVLQKNGILREISENNHLIELQLSNGFELRKNRGQKIDKIGINKAYSFKGFCKKHDTEIFEPIENGNLIDFHNPMVQALFSYRAVCQELRRKEISIDFTTGIMKYNEVQNKDMMQFLIDGMHDGIRNLYWFRNELERSLIENNYEDFEFNTVEFKKIELCISVPLNISELVLTGNEDYEEWKANKPNPIKTSFINIFPFKNKSYFIGGYHKKMPCNWTKVKLQKWAKMKQRKVFKELSDLIVLRLEFWIMSPRLYRSIPNTKIENYRKIFRKNLFEHSPKLRTKLNLFDHLK